MRSCRFEGRDEARCVCDYPGEVKRHVKQENDLVELEWSSVTEVEVHSPPVPVYLHDPGHFSSRLLQKARLLIHGYPDPTDGVLADLLGADSAAFWSMSPSDALLDLSYATSTPTISVTAHTLPSSAWPTPPSPALPLSVAPSAPHAVHLPRLAEPLDDQRELFSVTQQGECQSIYSLMFEN